jgi:hypothetical protein
MKPWRILIGVELLLVLALGLVVLQVSGQAAAPDTPEYQLLTNPGVENYDPPYGQYEDVDCQVATGWERFWYGGPEPYWMDTRVFADGFGTGWVERIEGETSQMVLATEPYTAGIWQQVDGLTPGVGYGFHAAMLTIFQTSAQDPVHGTMIKQVGMDPTGGTNPEAPTVVWSEPDDHDQGPWDIERRTAVYAESPTMTVFIRVISLYPSGGLPYLNQSFLDSAILAQTAVVTATSPAVSEVPDFTVNWDNAVPTPGGELRWYDVQWMDEAEGMWHGWFTRTEEVEASFTGTWGHTYRFRARAWQRYPNGAHLYGPYRLEGDTTTRLGGPTLAGRVLSPENLPVAGATVAISGTSYTTTSGPDGRFEMEVLAWPDPQVITVSHSAWGAPAPVYGVTFEPFETKILTWTLLPPGDVVANGGFETDSDGWSLIAAQGVTPKVVAEPVHTGLGALALGGAPSPGLLVSPPVSITVGVTQAVVVTGAWEPALSFWYRPVSTDTDDLFNVVLTVVTESISTTLPVTTTRVFTPPLDADGWQHLWYYPGLPRAALTGTVTIRFQVWQDGDEAATTVFLDEVSLGATPGGPYGIYLPLALKGS